MAHSEESPRTHSEYIGRRCCLAASRTRQGAKTVSAGVPEAVVLFHLLHYLTDLAAHTAPDSDALTLLRNLTGTVYGTAHLVRLLRRPGRRRDRRVVEPGMTFITPGVAAAGIKATGSVASALIGRYRPTGVPRLGSNEDRAEAYRRLLAAASRPTQVWRRRSRSSA